MKFLLHEKIFMKFTSPSRQRFSVPKPSLFLVKFLSVYIHNPHVATRAQDDLVHVIIHIAQYSSLFCSLTRTTYQDEGTASLKINKCFRSVESSIWAHATYQ